MAGGPGENGGAMLIDGPTFVATEGWDWLPAIRDRDTGIWQGVTLRQTGAVQLGDTQVVTRLPLPDRGSAEVEIHVPVHNAGQGGADGAGAGGVRGGDGEHDGGGAAGRLDGAPCCPRGFRSCTWSIRGFGGRTGMGRRSFTT